MTSPGPDLHAIAPRRELARRDVLRLIAGGVAALSAGCLTRAGDEELVAAVDEPEHHPGRPVRYASALALDGFATGVIVETRDGRPIKLDGNPAHPASLGGSLPWMQARILDLYDPQRATSAGVAGVPTTWAAIRARLRALPPGPVWLVLPPQSSPTIGGLLARVSARHELHVVIAAPLGRGNAYRGHALAYGRPVELQLEPARADVVVALDADLLAGMPMSAAWARGVARRRDPSAAMNRLWVIEPSPTPTGTLADERLAVPARDGVAVATGLVARLGRAGLDVPALPAGLLAQAERRLGGAAAWVDALAADLVAHRGAGAIVVGDRQPACVHALARWIDHACGNVGGAVALTEPALLDPPGGASLADLVAGAAAARAIVVVDADPVHTAPAGAGLAAALAAAPLSLHVGSRRDRTAMACRGFVPLAHELETWSDPRAADGTLAIAQPAIRPRFDVAALIDVLAALADDDRDARALIADQLGLTSAAWTDALRAGVVAGSRHPPLALAPAWPPAATAALAAALAEPAGLEIALARSPQLHDGRFAANAWLQELPHPITKQTWGNAALLSAATAARLGVGDEQLVTLATAAGAVTVPALIVAGACDGSVTLELGHGQRVPALPIADRIGGDGYLLRGGDELLLAGRIARAGGRARLARTQTTMTTEGREVAPTATVDELRANPRLTAHLRGAQPSMLPPRPQTGVQWGMSIDTSICTGCSACMVACQAENNIPTVGPVDVARGRHMNWLRVDRYVAGDVTVNQPVPCQHCEDAPCEYVCPVGATTHSPDGLNEQTYNRCVGTRFCANNCPYKVRRFNWFAYAPADQRALQYNPDVTVRGRGVMEKCTYCVQRIRRVEHQARVERRPIGVGEVVTACQQACPTSAIQFGQLDEDGTAFAALRRDPRRFDLLHELGTRPRTQYLARIRNPRRRS